MVDIAEIKRLLERATPGPVRVYVIECMNADGVIDELRTILAGTEGTSLPRGFWLHGAMTDTERPLSVSLAGCGGLSKENAALEVTLRNAAPALIAELAAARECVKQLRLIVDDEDEADNEAENALAAYDAATKSGGGNADR